MILRGLLSGDDIAIAGGTRSLLYLSMCVHRGHSAVVRAEEPFTRVPEKVEYCADYCLKRNVQFRGTT
jgi:hypothetical protein